MVAYWLKHWTADRKVQGFSPTCNRDIPGALSPTPNTFMSFGGDIKPSVQGTP